MILSNITKFPIVVIAPPRSGSIVTCSQIGFDLGIRYFYDLTYRDDQTEFHKFLDFAQTTDQYVIKFHSFDVNKYPSWLTDKIYSGTAYNIKVVRQNFLLHVASVYIAQIRDLYHYDKINIENYSGPIEVSYKRIAGCIKRLRRDLAELETLPIVFDTVIKYEDQQYKEDLCVKTPLPSNYNEVLAAIGRFL